MLLAANCAGSSLAWSDQAQIVEAVPKYGEFTRYCFAELAGKIESAGYEQPVILIACNGSGESSAGLSWRRSEAAQMGIEIHSDKERLRFVKAVGEKVA